MLTKGRETTNLHAAQDLKSLTNKFEQLKMKNENLEKDLRAEFAIQIQQSSNTRDDVQEEHRDEIDRL